MRAYAARGLTAAFLVSVFQLPGAWAQPDDAGLAEKGRLIVEKQCGRCHQTGATGASPLAIAPPFHELTQRYPPESLEEALGEGLATGHADMPEFVFEPDDVSAIVTYLVSLRAGGDGRRK